MKSKWLLLIFMFSCKSNSTQSIVSNDHQQESLSEPGLNESNQKNHIRIDNDPYYDLDPIFEETWNDKNNPEIEKAYLIETGKIFKEGVTARYNKNLEWYKEYKKLAMRDFNSLNSFEVKKLKRYKEVLGDEILNTPNVEHFLMGRSVHSKGYGCYLADVTMNGQNSSLNRGKFANGQHYKAIIRFSNGATRYVDDRYTSSHGMALKLLPANFDPIARSAQEINNNTQLNISNVNLPFALMYDPGQYNSVSKINARVSEDIFVNDYVDYKNKLVAAVKGIALANERVILDSRTSVLALAVTGKLIDSPLMQEYYSMTAFRLGEPGEPNTTAVKYKMRPCTNEGEIPSWSANSVFHTTTDLGPLQKYFAKLQPATKIVQNRSKNYLYENTQNRLKSGDFCMTLSLQQFISPKETPIEDPTEIWVESEQQKKDWGLIYNNLNESTIKPTPTKFKDKQIAPFNQVGQINIAKLTESNQIDEAVCDQLSFNTWNNVPTYHKPLGIANRMRWFAYSNSLAERTRLREVFQNNKDK